jgi:hypothetical protein
MKTILFLISILFLLFDATVAIISTGFFAFLCFSHAPAWYFYADLLILAFFSYHACTVWVYLESISTDTDILE